MFLRRRLLILSTAALLSACFSHSEADLPDVPFTQLDGSQHRTGDFKGKVVLVNFWATSCTTCVKEMPHIVSTHQQFQAQGLETLAVAMSYDPPAYVMQFAQTRQLPFRVAIDHDGGIAKAFGDVELTPTTLVIDRDGHIVKRYVGEPDFKALNALLSKLLAKPAA